MSSPRLPFASRAPRGAKVNWSWGTLHKGDYLVLTWERSPSTGLYTVHRITRNNEVNIGTELKYEALVELIAWYTKKTDVRWEKVRPIIDRLVNKGTLK